MKRLFITLVTVMLGLAAAAQAELPAADSTAAKAAPSVATDSAVATTPHERVIDGGHSKKSSGGEANVVGMPRYYGDSAYADEPFEYRRPRGGAMRYFGHDFCSYFGEFRFLTGTRDVGLGFDLAYVPTTWGFYAGYMYGVRYDWFSLGAVWRLSEPWDGTDLQLYAGLNYGQWIGYEVGARIAVTQSANWGDFCWTSASLGLLRNNGHSYVTIGLSFDLTMIPLLFLF